MLQFHSSSLFLALTRLRISRTARGITPGCSELPNIVWVLPTKESSKLAKKQIHVSAGFSKQFRPFLPHWSSSICNLVNKIQCVTYQHLLVHTQTHWHFVHSICEVEWASLMRGKPLVESSALHEKRQSCKILNTVNILHMSIEVLTIVLFKNELRTLTGTGHFL